MSELDLTLDNIVDADSFHVEESTAEEPKKIKTAAIVGGIAVGTAGVGVGGYYIWKHHISKTGRVEWQRKKAEKHEKRYKEKLKKDWEKLEKYEKAIAPNVKDLDKDDDPKK